MTQPVTLQGERKEKKTGHELTSMTMRGNLLPLIVGARITPGGCAADTGDKDPYTQWAHGEYIVGTDNT